jgi:hypothetical protein
MIGSETIVYSVTDMYWRNRLLNQLYNTLTDNPDITYTVEKEQPNKIKVYHNVSQDNRILIRTYLVVVVPVQVDISKLHNNCYGKVRFNLEETIAELQRNIGILEALQNTHFLNGDNNGSTFRSLAESLCGTDVQHRTSKTL